jgi:hypothetical protein
MRVEKTQLIALLQSLNFSAELDSAIWVLESSDLYSVNSMYTFLNFGGVKCPIIKSVWTLKIPLKHKLFFIDDIE